MPDNLRTPTSQFRHRVRTNRVVRTRRARLAELRFRPPLVTMAHIARIIRWYQNGESLIRIQKAHSGNAMGLGTSLGMIDVYAVLTYAHFYGYSELGVAGKVLQQRILPLQECELPLATFREVINYWRQGFLVEEIRAKLAITDFRKTSAIYSIFKALLARANECTNLEKYRHEQHAILTGQVDTIHRPDGTVPLSEATRVLNEHGHYADTTSAHYFNLESEGETSIDDYAIPLDEVSLRPLPQPALGAAAPVAPLPTPPVFRPPTPVVREEAGAGAATMPDGCSIGPVEHRGRAVFAPAIPASDPATAAAIEQQLQQASEERLAETIAAEAEQIEDRIDEKRLSQVIKAVSEAVPIDDALSTAVTLPDSAMKKKVSNMFRKK